ncbi:MAG: ATP-binding cassette domain-containing protein [Polyangiales bacterium]
MLALIEFRDVHKAFGEKVYRGLSLSIDRGESLTIIGGSGQGKSVMLKMFRSRLLEVDKGEIIFDGESVSNDFPESQYRPVRRRVAMLFQASALFDSLNVFENVAYGLRTDDPPARRSASSLDSPERVELRGIETCGPRTSPAA